MRHHARHETARACRHLRGRDDGSDRFSNEAQLQAVPVTIKTGSAAHLIAEASTGRLDRFVQAVAKDHPGAARMVRTVLKNMMLVAVLHEAIDRNPMTETRAINRGEPQFRGSTRGRVR